MGLLADALISRGHEVLWWANAFSHLEKKWIFKRDTLFEINEKYKIFALKGIGYKKNISIARFIDHRIIAWKFKKYAQKMLAPDLIVAASPSHDLAYQAVIFGKKKGIPVIVDIRDDWPDDLLNAFPVWLRKIARLLLSLDFRMFRVAMQEAHGLISTMAHLLNYGLKYAGRTKGPNDRVFYIGCYSSKPSVEIPPKLAFLEKIKDKFIVTFVGTLIPTYNPSILIECAEMLLDKDIHFVIAGDGELFQKLKAKAKGLSNLSMPGWLNQKEIDTLLQYSKIGVCTTPTFIKAFPNKIFTYLSGGLPIIASIQGELRELIEEYQIGFYYPPNDTRVLTDCILKLYMDKNLYKKTAENAKKIFNKMFNAEKIYPQLVEHLTKIVEIHKNRGNLRR